MNPILSHTRNAFTRMVAMVDWQHKLRTKIVWMVLLLGGLPLTIFALITMQMGVAYVTMDTVQQNQEKVTQMSKIIDMYYGSSFEFLRRYINDKTEFGNPSPQSSFDWMNSLSRQVFQRFTDVSAISTLDSQGRIQVYTPAVAKQEQWRRLAFQWARAYQGNAGLEKGEPQYFNELEETVVPIYITLVQRKYNRVLYQMTVYYSLRSLWDKQVGIHFNDHSRAVLMDSEGHKVIKSHARLRKLEDFAQSDELAPIKTTLIKSIPWFMNENIQLLQSSARCPQLGWKISLQGDPAFLLERIKKIRIIILSFWIGSFIFLLAGGIWFVSRLIQPLENLETGIKLISSGLMGDELPVYSHDEIGRLTQTFNQMTRTLMLRNEEIRGKTRELTFFNTITRIINQSVDLKTILDHSLQKILQLMHATSGMSYIYQPHLKQFKLISYFGVTEEFVNENSQLDLSQELLAKIFSSGEPSMIRDVPRHGDAYEIIRHENIRDLLLVPLRSKKRTLGVLGVGSRRKRFFHYRDLDLLARIGDEIGMMVENALLYTELQLKIKELEDANKELQELDRLKNRFLSNVSHELRTPITSIKTYVELFLEDKIGSLDEVQKDKLFIVRRNINNLMTLINDLLTLSRLEDQKSQTFPLEVISITELAEQVFADTVEMARVKGISMLRKGLVEPFPVNIHRQRIQQVLQNLLSNAIKFTEKGTVTLSLKRVFVSPNQDYQSADQPVAAVEISVTDTGIGIPEEELSKLFQRFYQVDSSSTRKYVGTGLGLAIVKEILAAYNTEPHVESEVGKGSRFWFVLPLVELTHT